MRIIGIALLVAIMLFGFFHYFGKPTGLPPEVVQVLNPTSVEKPREEKKEEALPGQADQPAPQDKSEAKGVTKKSLAAASATETDRKAITRTKTHANTGKHRTIARKAAHRKHDWELSDTPPPLPHIAASSEQLAAARQQAEEKERAIARRDVEAANDAYIRIVQDIDKGR